MPPAILNNTIQAVVLAGTSCVIGQLLTAYKNDVWQPDSVATLPLANILLQTQFSIDFRQLVQFLIFAVLNSPPNFLWYVRSLPSLLALLLTPRTGKHSSNRASPLRT
jgi:protein Mpv17